MLAALSFSHPFTDEQRVQACEFVGGAIEEIRTISVQIDQGNALEPQICAIVDSAGLTSQEWQTRQFLINPPGYAGPPPLCCWPNSMGASDTSQHLFACAHIPGRGDYF